MTSNHVISCNSPPLRQQRQHDISSVRLTTWDRRPPNRKLELVSISEARLQPSSVFLHRRYTLLGSGSRRSDIPFLAMDFAVWAGC
jgi:hypothetical protein